MRNIITGLFLLLIYYLSGQVLDPVPEAIQASGLVFELEDVVTVPISGWPQPRARINMLREAPDGSGRLFVNDLRGKFWVVEEGGTTLYANPLILLEGFISEPGKGTGFGAFAFHPEFAANGKLYTAHATRSNTAPADFTPIKDNGIELQWVLTEWTADDPGASQFKGSRRELLRLDFPSFLHGIQDIQFNPNAAPGDKDYGLLYVCIGDGGSSLRNLPENIQNKASYLGTILRIDPLGTNSHNGAYGIPDSNPFVQDTNALGELWAYGFRNPHRITWDREGDYKMLIGDIGEKNIEEINLGIAGGNYGWNKREGTFAYRHELGRDFVYPLPDEDSLSYVYPVAQYDHDEGLAIVGGHVYRGTHHPALWGKYIFGDIVSGRIFFAEADTMIQGSLATIQEIHFVDSEGRPITLLDLVDGDRADLRFGIDAQSEIYILTKADGKIRKLKSSVTTGTLTPVVEKVSWLSPNPGNGQFQLQLGVSAKQDIDIQVIDMMGRSVWLRHFALAPNSIDLSRLHPGVYWVKWNIDNQYFVQQINKL